ncbi:hypothetical protein KL943_001372 [Ogataea angusta]|nr:hypothetical protein KL943_001372 [Ogataea angusta]
MLGTALRIPSSSAVDGPPRKSSIICIPPPPEYSSTSTGSTEDTPSKNQTLSFISSNLDFSLRGHTAVNMVAAPLTWNIHADGGRDLREVDVGRDALARESIIRIKAAATRASVFSGDISSTASRSSPNASARCPVTHWSRPRSVRERWVALKARTECIRKGYLKASIGISSDHILESDIPASVIVGQTLVV